MLEKKKHNTLKRCLNVVYHLKGVLLSSGCNIFIIFSTTLCFCRGILHFDQCSQQNCLNIVGCVFDLCRVGHVLKKRLKF